MLNVNAEFHQILAIECFVFALVCTVAHLFFNRKRKPRMRWDSRKGRTTETINIGIEVLEMPAVGKSYWKKVG